MIVILLIQFQAWYSQAGDETEGGDTNTVYGVVDTMGTTYMYTMNMIQPSLATGILYTYIPSFHPGRIWAFSYSPVEYIALLAFAWQTSTLHSRVSPNRFTFRVWTPHLLQLGQDCWSLRTFVLREPIAQKDRRFCNDGQLQVVAWTGEVQDTKTDNVLLVLGRGGNPVDRALDVVGSKQIEGITSIDSI